MIRAYVAWTDLPQAVRTVFEKSPHPSSYDWPNGYLPLRFYDDEEGIYFVIDEEGLVIPAAAKGLKIAGISARIEMWSVRRECGIYHVGRALAELTTSPSGDDYSQGVDTDHLHYSLATRGIVPLDNFRQILYGIRDGTLPPQTSWDKPCKVIHVGSWYRSADEKGAQAYFEDRETEVSSGDEPYEALGRFIVKHANELGLKIVWNN